MNLFDVMTGPVSRMSYVTRYSSFPANRRENVAEHSWWVAFISYTIGLDLKYHGIPVRIGLLLERALVHDLSECVSGDVIRSYKHTNESVREAMAQADAINMDKLSEDWEPIIRGIVLHHWDHAKAADTEGDIIRFADMVAVALYCREEDRCGNRAIREVLQYLYENWFLIYHTHPLLGGYMDQLFPTKTYRDMFDRPMTDDELRRLVQTSVERGQGIPMMMSHDEGPVAEHDWTGAGEGTA